MHFAAWGPERPRSSQTPEKAPEKPATQGERRCRAWASKRDGGHPGCTAGPGQTMSSDLGGGTLAFGAHNSQPEQTRTNHYLHSYGGPFKADTLRSRRQKPAAAPHPARTLRPCTDPRGAARVENKITAKNQAIVMLRKGQAQRGFRASQPKPLFGARWTPGESAHKDLSGIETPGGRPLLFVSPCTKTARDKTKTRHSSALSPWPLPQARSDDPWAARACQWSN